MGYRDEADLEFSFAFPESPFEFPFDEAGHIEQPVSISSSFEQGSLGDLRGDSAQLLTPDIWVISSSHDGVTTESLMIHDGQGGIRAFHTDGRPTTIAAWPGFSGEMFMLLTGQAGVDPADAVAACVQHTANCDQRAQENCEDKGGVCHWDSECVIHVDGVVLGCEYTCCDAFSDAVEEEAQP